MVCRYEFSSLKNEIPLLVRPAFTIKPSQRGKEKRDVKRRVWVGREVNGGNVMGMIV